MPFQVSADPGTSVVRVTYDGPTTIDHRLDALAEGEAMLRSTGYVRVLVDLRAAATREEPLDRSNAFATRLSQSDEVRRCRLAFLVPPHQHGNRLIETMAVARHLEVERFEREDDALGWLCCTAGSVVADQPAEAQVDADADVDATVD